METTFKKHLVKLSNNNVIEILRRQELNLDEIDLEILKKSKISGASLLLFQKEDFYRNGMATGPTLAIMEFIQKLKTGSYRESNEIAFHTAIEVLLRNISIRYISELQLITKYKENSQNCEITYGSSDIFLPDNNLGQDCVVIELKLFNLIGLYSGNLYTCQWKEIILIGVESGYEQLSKYINVISKGKGKVYNDGVGVADNRITG
ncbi:14836_t:CDS:2 [Funneliformis mosseae]|uniref:14836_t:CDS:1 n=1 Tax=Funneliformis mosseae TaxID=27381 RepID=A0A9N9C8L3_FUNMO|nr:14836_t:CDS:2 [Funneliformis mosseae]